MPTFLIVILCFIGAVAAVCGFGLQLMAGADAEGRLMSLMPWGDRLLIAGAIAFIGFGLWALARWIGWYGVAGAVVAIYVAGGIVACHRITHSTQEYDTRILVKGALYSWLGVLLMDAG